MSQDIQFPSEKVIKCDKYISTICFLPEAEIQKFYMGVSFVILPTSWFGRSSELLATLSDLVRSTSESDSLQL